MKRTALLVISLIGMAALLAASVPLIAQARPGSHLYAYPPIRLSNLPQNTSIPVGILPVQFKAAYGFNQIPNLGQGQTIAIVDANDDPNIAADLAHYASYFHLTPCNFQKVKVGNPQPDSGWALEISLDVEQACALAPQANIILVEANAVTLDDLFAAIQVASSAPYNATVISMSWDLTGEEASELQYDRYLCNIVSGNGHPVTFVNSSGDWGHVATYPAASPCVLAVGGTVLALAETTPLPNPLQLNYGAEIAWEGSSGGVSAYESQMSWQNPACATWSTTNRCIPDVASVAANIPLYDTYGSFSGWYSVMGTSISTPDWAAFLTLVNSIRAGQGKNTLSQVDYDLYQIYYSGNYSTDFHDITTGSNGNCGSQCNAGPRYDLVTGMGTFQANRLVNALVAAPN